MPIYDISVPLMHGMTIYPGDPDIQIQDWNAISKGDSANLSFLHFGAHTGTHVDAPAHFIEGAPQVESLPLEVLIGEVQVVDVPDKADSIDQAFVNERCAPGISRVLFKTRNSGFWRSGDSEFKRNYCYLELLAAEHLVPNGNRIVGIDYLSIEKSGNPGHPTHLALLSNGVVILEGLNLSDVPEGHYELICLPLRIRGGQGDGAPARAVLRTLD